MIAAAVIAALAAAAATVPAYRWWPRATAWTAVGVAAALAALLLACVPAVARGDTLATSLPWLPALGVHLALRLDGLALLFGLLVTVVGALVLVYAIGYLGHGPKLGRLLALLLLFLGSMLGLVLADDTIALFVFWELTSISSYFLIAFDDTSAEARRRARRALLVTSAGGLALLVGVLLLAGAAADLGAPAGVAVAPSALAGLDLAGHPHYVAIVVLIALAAFTKSAQVPFHTWLPGAMVAPTPVSAYLHSATMVKAGVFVLARFHPALGDTALWTTLLVGVGGATVVIAGALALLQRDLKLTLAYSTISVLGALTALIGLGTPAALEAFVVFVLAHAAYKATLFLVAGNIDHHRGHRDPFTLDLLADEMPASAAAAVLAAASMAGIPPLLGFIGKEALYYAAITGPAAVAVGAAIVVGGACLVAAAWIAAFQPFFRGERGLRGWYDAPATMLVGPVALAALGVALAVAPGVLVDPIAGPAASAIAGAPRPFEVALWRGLGGAHGVTLVLSAVSLVAGTAAYVAIARRPDAARGVARALRVTSPEGVLDALGRGIDALVIETTRLTQSGRVPRYVAILVVVTVAAVGAPLALDVAAAPPRAPAGTRAFELPLLALAAAGAVAAAVTRDRLATVAAVGATGLAIAFLFALYSAPDLAITQLMVEMLMVILLVAMFRRVGVARLRDPPPRRAVHTALAVAAGALATLLLLATGAPPDAPPTASDTFVAEATRDGDGNVVNAILVGFRALDTLGEILVVAIAGVGVLALVRRHAQEDAP